MKPTKYIAIVGAGPRGTSALESLYLQYAQNSSNHFIHTLLFEATEHLGCGPIYRQKQPDSNWLNISERFLELEERPSLTLEGLQIPSFPSYHQWSNYNAETALNTPDYYPPRSKLGLYLQERFWSLAGPLQKEGFLKIIPKQVYQINVKKPAVEIHTTDNTIYSANEVLLTIGHQATCLSKQIQTWQNFATENEQVSLFKEAYPIQQFTKETPVRKDNVIALRGFGLAMMDVVRGILEDLGGRFIHNKAEQSITFESSKDTPIQFVPFSLDGLPMSPKPLNQQIDNWFKPTTQELQKVKDALEQTLSKYSTDNNLFLIQAFAPIAAAVYTKLDAANPVQLSQKELEEIIILWLGNSDYQHHLVTPKSQAAEISMRNYIAMALGNVTASLDYCIGQVWRHCQPTFYKTLSFSSLSDTVVKSIIDLDERMKRYAYGPPVSSIQQLIALIDSGVLNLDFVDNPKIDLSPEGWILSSKQQSIKADVMIDTVLDAPQLLSVCTPLVQNLLIDDLVQPIHDKLGILTNQQSYILSEDEKQHLPIAVLGRLCKGTVIGVDAILECFGDRSKKWAVKAIQ